MKTLIAPLALCLLVFGCSDAEQIITPIDSFTGKADTYVKVIPIKLPTHTFYLAEVTIDGTTYLVNHKGGILQKNTGI